MARNGYKRISTEGETKNVSFVSLLFFQWMNNVFKTGNERTLEENDFLPLSEENSTGTLTEQLQTKWNKESRKCKLNGGKRPKLWKSVLKMLSVKEGIILTFTGALISISSLLQPLFLGYLISTIISTPEPQKNSYLYGCALAMGINAMINGVSMHHFFYRCDLLSIRSRSSVKGLVYVKVSTNLLADGPAVCSYEIRRCDFLGNKSCD